MNKVWFIADTHFGHGPNILNWRPAFSSVEEMSLTIVNNINKIVKPTDTLYLLGDIVITRKGMQYLEMLNGRLILIPGNHDGEREGLKLSEYPVDKILASSQVKIKEELFWLTHIPVHPTELGVRVHGNIHGHLHDKVIPDNRYICVSCEQTGYLPVDKDFIYDKFSTECF